MDTPPRDCDHGFHGALVAALPIENETSVEINYICPVCEQIEYTESWSKAGWRPEDATRTAKETA